MTPRQLRRLARHAESWDAPDGIDMAEPTVHPDRGTLIVRLSRPGTSVIVVAEFREPWGMDEVHRFLDSGARELEGAGVAAEIAGIGTGIEKGE